MHNNLFDGLDNIFGALRLWRLWVFWGWLDVRQRYRRSLLGPFWVTMTMALSVFATGVIYAYLFKQDVKEYLPYVATGFVLWSFLSGYIGEACLVFIQNESFLGQLSLPYLVYPLRLLWRYISIFLHHAIVLIAVILLFVKVAPVLLLSSLLGLVVLSVNIFWIGVLLGLVSARYRDVPVLISTAFQLLFLVTPVIWPAKVLGAKIGLADLNPFYHFLESVRAPLLEPSSIFFNRHLIISFLIAVVGLCLTIVIFIRWRRRLLYWL